MTAKEFEETGGTSYSDWFGSGNTLNDYRAVVTEEGKPPEEVFITRGSACMICLVFPNKIVVVGYDGNEYCHQFEFPKEKQG